MPPQVHDSLGKRAMLDAAEYQPRRLATAPRLLRSRSPSPEREASGAGGAAGGGAGVGAFEPPPPSGQICAKEGCGRGLLWFEIGPPCSKCMREDGASPQLRMLHTRFLIKHPNAALVAALQEMADYLEVRTRGTVRWSDACLSGFLASWYRWLCADDLYAPPQLFGEKDDFRSAESFRRAAAALKATPRDVRDVATLDALALPFIADKMRNVYLKQFWDKGTMQRLEILRTPAKIAARRLARAISPAWPP